MKIRMHTSPKLRTISKPIKKLTLDVKKLAKKMKRYVEKNKNCVGLAAPQIGKNLRLVVARLHMEDINGEEGNAKQMIEVMIDPIVIFASDDKETDNEACLSCPGYEIAVSRSRRVVVEYRDLSGQRCAVNLVGMQARILQHEIDHLDGVLILDHSSEPLK